MSLRNSINLKNIGLGVAFFIIFAIVSSLVSPYIPFIWYRILIAPLAFFMITYLSDRELPHYISVIMLALIVYIIYQLGIDVVSVIQSNVSTVPEWDFHFFWAYGRVAVEGLNPYIPSNLVHALAPINPSQPLLAELFYFYPPPTLFLYLPLGWFDVNNAYIVWYGIIISVLIADIYLIWKIFISRQTRVMLLCLSALVLIFKPTMLTIGFGQTNFILMFFMLLFWDYRNKWVGGVWLALAIMIKPIAAVFMLYLILKRRWTLIGSLIGSTLVLLIATSIVFGPDMVLSFFTNNSIVNDMPTGLYAESINQSLLGEIVRWLAIDLSIESPYSPLFIIIAGIMTTITTGCILFLPEEHSDWLFILCVSLAVLIYPKTLEHYNFIGIVAILLLIIKSKLLPYNWFIGTIGSTFIFALHSIDWFFEANMIIYIVIHGAAIFWILKHSLQKDQNYILESETHESNTFSGTKDFVVQ